LVVGIRHHGGGGHRFALAGEQFVGLVAEDTAEVGDRGVDLGEQRGEGVDGETGDGGRRCIASEPVEKGARIARAPRTWCRRRRFSQRLVPVAAAAHGVSTGAPDRHHRADH
jgi:hypothetical protein